MAREPGFYFYTGDWLKEPALMRCTKSAKGCWIDMLAVLSECPLRGVFAGADGEPWSIEEIARAIGGDTVTNQGHIEELLRLGVASRNQRGAIYSRRMVRDEQAKLSERDRKRKVRESVRHLSGDCPVNVPPIVRPLSEEEREVERGMEFGDSEFQKVALIWEKGAGESMAEHEYCELLEKGEKPDVILKGLKAIDAVIRETWAKDQLRWIPKLATMLHNKRYKETPILWDRQEPNLVAMEAKVGGR